ncbi:CTL-like protein 2 isoform X1 [Cimex lectularius]|uniref:Choline transporter-like protein n=1 Tax=Cimex lectularius TaxID=79782 RepID=A0A8I6RWE8_CIMLE|nr:CTL-like protein 2 isoform X1 [Cimex lectularius]
MAGRRKREISTSSTGRGSVRPRSSNERSPAPVKLAQSKAEVTPDGHPHDAISTRDTGSPLKHDKNFKGPCKNRSCTDVIFLAIFIAFLILWGGVAYFGFLKGNPENLLITVDSNGKKCGVDSEVLDKPYLFFFDLSKCATPSILLSGCNTVQMCVKECPQQNWAFLPYKITPMLFNPSNIQKDVICTDDVDKSSIKTLNQLEKLINDEKCANWYISSKPVLGRCISLFGNFSGFPMESEIQAVSDSSVQIADPLWDSYTEGYKFHKTGRHLLDDLMRSWKVIILALVISVLVSLLYISLLRWIAGIIIWVTLIGVVALLITCCIFSWRRYMFLKDSKPIDTKAKMLEGQFEELLKSKDLFFWLTVVVAVFTLIILLLIIFLRKRIQIAISLIQEGSKAVSNVISSLFFPIIPWFFQVCVGLWVIFVWACLQSVGEKVFKVNGFDGSHCRCGGAYEKIKNGDLCVPDEFSNLCIDLMTGFNCTTASCDYFKTQPPSYMIFLHMFNVFGFFWGFWFLSGLSDMILAGTFAKWYWTFNKKDVPFFTVTGAALTTVRYHLGTIAFGSLIIAICSFIRATIEYVQKKTKAYDNPVVKAILCCCRCFFWCLEKFLRFINRNAYIMCAIHGRNFCHSALEAFNLLMRNIIRVVVLDKVTDFLFFIGKLVITGSVVAIAYLLFFMNNPQNLYFKGAVPLSLIAIGAYFISSIFFGVYAMAVDTLFLCFLEDCERNDGSIDKPYFMSKNLMQILGKRNKKQS